MIPFEASPSPSATGSAAEYHEDVLGRPARSSVLPLRPPPSTRPRRALILAASLVVPAAFLLARPLARFGLVFDLMANVSYFAAVPLVVTALVAAWSRHWGVTGIAAGLAVAAVWPVISAVMPDGPLAAGEGPSVRVLLCNVEGSATAMERLLEVIDREDPDVVAIVEAEMPVVEWLAESPRLRDKFPFRVAPRIGQEWPHVVLSRHAIEPVRFRDEHKRYWGLFTFHRAVIMSLPAGRVVFSVEHLPSPRTTVSWKDGNRRIELLGEVVQQYFKPLGLPVVIAGDFNATPSGYRHWLLASRTGLQPDRVVGLPTGTWPSSLPDFCRLPLDRVWGSDDVIFGTSKVLESIGSDHRPVLVTFQLRQQEDTPVISDQGEAS